MPPDQQEQFHQSVKTLLTELVLSEILNLNQRLDRIENRLKLMPLIDDLNAATANIIAKNDALLALVQQLVDAAKNNPPPEQVQAVIDQLNAEAAKDDGVLNPPPPAP